MSIPQTDVKKRFGGKHRRLVGVINAEGPPVPIPNTEVKLCRADDTWLATARENRYAPTLDDGG